MDKTTHEVRLENWKAVVERCQSRPKGQSARQWLADNGISDKQYYYWQRKIRAQAYSEAHNALSPVSTEQQTPVLPFAEIPAGQILDVPSSPVVVIKTGKSTIEISSAASDVMVVQIVKAVSHAL